MHVIIHNKNKYMIKFRNIIHQGILDISKDSLSLSIIKIFHFGCYKRDTSSRTLFNVYTSYVCIKGLWADVHWFRGGTLSELPCGRVSLARGMRGRERGPRQGGLPGASRASRSSSCSRTLPIAASRLA